MSSENDRSNVRQLNPFIEKAVLSLREPLDLRILDLLLKEGPLPFSELIKRLKLKPTTLDRSLTRMMNGALLNNFYERNEKRRTYSYYEATLLGRDLFNRLADMGEVNSVVPSRPYRAAYQIVIFDLDGVIFKRPWNDSTDDVVAVGTWDLLFKKLDAYEDHERLKNEFKSGRFKSYNDWTEEACRVLQAKGLTKKAFYEVINSREYNDGVKDTLRTLNKSGVVVGVVTGSFYELAERVQQDIGVEVHIYAHCRLEFNEEGLLATWGKSLTDYEDKTTFLTAIEKADMSLRNVAYVGDDVNDIPVFKKVGLAIAFNAIKEKVKKSADIVVEGIDLRRILPHLTSERIAGAPPMKTMESNLLRDSKKP